MTETILLLACSALIVLAGFLVARIAAVRTGWAAAGPCVLIAAAPLLPSVPIGAGLSLDDILPLVGVALLIPLVSWRSLRGLRWEPRTGALIAFIGIVLMILAGAISAVLNASDLVEFVKLLARGPGRMVFLLAIAAVVAIVGSTPRSKRFTAQAIAMIGLFEAVFGLVAYFVGLPMRAGLELVIHSSVLYGQVPGRISGTIGNSPNFTGALFIITILVTAGLALRQHDRRPRILWWLAVVVQLAALTLTYSRVSLGLTVLGLVVLVLLRSRPILLLPIGAVLVSLALFTPLVSRLFNDAQNRVALWTSGLLLMLDHPLGGVGPGEMLKAVAADPQRYRYTPLGSAWSTAHNTIFLAGAETGVLGAIGAIVLNAGLLLVAFRALRSATPGPAGTLQVAAALALAGFLAQGMVNNLFTVGVTGVFAAFLVGSQLLDVRLTDGVEARDVVAGATGEEASVPVHQGAG